MFLFSTLFLFVWGLTAALLITSSRNSLSFYNGLTTPDWRISPTVTTPAVQQCFNIIYLTVWFTGWSLGPSGVPGVPSLYNLLLCLSLFPPAGSPLVRSSLVLFCLFYAFYNIHAPFSPSMHSLH